MWRVLWQLRKSVAEKEVESVKVEIDADINAGFTLIGSMAVNGDGLPLFLIAKEVTARHHRQFGGFFPGSIDSSKSVSVKQELFLRFLSFIYSNREMGLIALVLFQYSAHLARTSHAKGRKPGVKLILVLKGGTVRD
jgi:hypothetical protein